jgi:hypothetical protein
VERNNRRDHVIASVQFLLRRRRSLLRNHSLIASSGAPGRLLFESLSQMVMLRCIAPRRASRRRRADPARTLSLCSLLAGLSRVLSRVWRKLYLEYRQRQRHDRPAGRCRRCVSAWMVPAQSMPRIAGRASCLRRTSSFRAEPYEPQKSLELGTVVRLDCAHMAYARSACTQAAGGANVRLASVLQRCAMGALCVRTTSSLGAAYRTQIPQMYSVLVYHAPELGFLAPARGQTLRSRTAMAPGQLDRQRRGHAYGSYLGEWLLADLDGVLCIRNTCQCHSTCAKPMTVTSINHSMRVCIDKLVKSRYSNDACSTLLHLSLR